MQNHQASGYLYPGGQHGEENKGKWEGEGEGEEGEMHTGKEGLEEPPRG